MIFLPNQSSVRLVLKIQTLRHQNTSYKHKDAMDVYRRKSKHKTLLLIDLIDGWHLKRMLSPQAISKYRTDTNFKQWGFHLLWVYQGKILVSINVRLDRIEAFLCFKWVPQEKSVLIMAYALEKSKGVEKGPPLNTIAFYPSRSSVIQIGYSFLSKGVLKCHTGTEEKCLCIEFQLQTVEFWLVNFLSYV